MKPEEAIEMLRGMQNKKVDYAELVCAPAFASGYTYVYPEPEDYAIEEAISALKEIQQYRKIGTVEDLKSWCSLFGLNGFKELEEYKKIGTVEECREAIKKQTPKRPVWKKGRSVICKDYADGHGEVEENKWADWVCPNCGWFVGEQYIPRRHNQQKSNYCSRCGQAIQWDKNLKGMEDEL